jgi:hypothetical protein
MNDYGLSAFQMIQAVMPLMVIAPLLIWMLVIGPLLVYPLARWKASREGVSDGQLGLKVALHYFKMLALQVMLFGGLILLWTIIVKGGGKSESYRAAFGFLVPAGVVFAVHHWFIRHTNDESFPIVRRLYLGYTLLITGFVGFAFLVGAAQVIFAKGSTGDSGRLFVAGMLVYGGAWIGFAMQFSRLVFGDPGASAGSPPSMIAPSQSQGAQASGGGPSLPPLGSAYPPIETK